MKTMLAEAGFSGDFVIRRTELGKPYFAPPLEKVYFSLSYSGEWIFCGLWKGEIGVDIEVLRPCSPYALKKAFTAEETLWVKAAESPEKAFFALWTAKEAYVKYRGLGLGMSLKNVPLTLDGESIGISPSESLGFISGAEPDYAFCAVYDRA